MYLCVILVIITITVVCRISYKKLNKLKEENRVSINSHVEIIYFDNTDKSSDLMYPSHFENSK